MDIQLLQAFVAVAELHSFSLAAQQLHLTQSAVSKRIGLLEQQLSAPLFDRMGRSVVLTESGALLLPKAKQLINDSDNVIRLIREHQGQVTGTLRIATSHHIGVHRLPPYLKQFTSDFPDVQLQVHFLDSEQAIEAISDGQFDLAIITLPEQATDDGSEPIQQHILWQDPMQFVVGKEHSLVKKKSVTTKDLAQFPAILPDINTRTTRLVKDVLADKGIDVTVSMTTNHLDAIKMMVNVGLGWSALPQTLIDKTVVPINIIGLKKTTLVRELGCIHHRQRTLSNAARAMLNNLKQP